MPERILQFSATVGRQGSRTVIVLPDSVVTVWGEKPHHYVAGTIAGHSFRGRTERLGGSYVLPVGTAWLRDNPIEADNQVPVELWLEPPQVDDLPADFASALKAEPEALAFFESLATHYRKGYLRWVEEAKRPETRAQRIEESVQLLREGRRQR